MWQYCEVCYSENVIACCSLAASSMLVCVAICCSVLQCVAVCCSVLQCVAVCCGVLQCVAAKTLSCAAHWQPLHCWCWWCSLSLFVTVCASVLQRVAACCSVLQRVAVCYRDTAVYLTAKMRSYVAQWRSLYCLCVLQCVTVCCSVLQQKCDLALPNGGLFIVCVYYNMLQCVAAKMLSCECVWVSE